MVDLETFEELCLALPGVEKVAHWNHPAFRTKRRIFTTLWPETTSANFAFTPDEQAAFCKEDPKSFYPVEGGWGRQGWTAVNLKKVKKGMLVNAINSAWYNAAPPKLQEQYRLEKGL
ncbi:MmcQ/YjbR family DNA-binding protein [Chitinophaga sp. SYP-B3965]|uniref:MmcQ/YjbR family DNA-binding protein n=1 Tax=Chitinophaga sp. SYP-B3965 TaxID=2663120 RepID=UPI001299F6C9|nr:MmcQ/YjbR family DNA-binding protein [Chitinophaga sp. SYP-B3965]MRG48395.1 MmcQ/YjbR family DNA-binding protein [Chitinophaga sp. SYP-B3965]